MPERDPIPPTDPERNGVQPSAPANGSTPGRALKPKLKRGCPDCPPMVVPRRGYTPTRPSCIHCVEKHLGAAMVLLAELQDHPDPQLAGDSQGQAPYAQAGNAQADDPDAASRRVFSRRLRAIGHLFEAEDESQQWPNLHAAIREARQAFQAGGKMPDFEQVGALAAAVRRAV